MSSLALFFSAFLAATILPFSSEAALVVAIESQMDPFMALVIASCGNILAIIFNYFLGLLLLVSTKDRLKKSRSGRKALYFGHKYGYYALLLSWLPIIGDPITLVAGVLRLNFFYFFMISATLRILRYLVIVLALT